MTIKEIKDHLHDRSVLAVLSHSQYKPTSRKMKQLADRYEADADISAFACYDNGIARGVIVLKRLAPGEFEIMSIAVDPDDRNRGIASKLIAHASGLLGCRVLKAETDDDAIGFYRSYGFATESLGEKYPGTIRYLCTLREV